MADGDSNFTNVVTSGTVNIGGTTFTVYESSEAWTPSAVAGAEDVETITITGAALGDYALVSFSLDVEDLVLDAKVTAADTVTYQAVNHTTGTITLSAGTAKILVISTS